MRTVIVFFVLAIAASVCNAQWIQTSGPGGGEVTSFAVLGTSLFAGTWAGGVFLSTNNGTSWTAVNNGLTNTNVLSLADLGTNLFSGTFGGGVFLSTNNGTSWTAVNSGLTNTSVQALAVSGTNLFAGSLGGIFLSTNNGTSWTAVNPGPNAVTTLRVSETNLFAGTLSGVFRSTDNGTSWTAVNGGLANTTVYDLWVSGTNLFAATNGSGVFRSTNNGTSWTAAGLTGTAVFGLAMIGTNLFAGTSGSGVFLSTNNGTSWTAAGLTSRTISGIVALGTNLFAGTFSDGAFLSTNNGTNWTPVNAGLGSFFVCSFAMSGPYVFAGTNDGVWRRPLSEMITDVAQGGSDIPTQYVLSQNFPNPYNPTTTIRYGLPHTSFVTLTIYNTLGQQVAQLVNEQQPAGYHDVVFRGDGLASGVYFYRIQAGDFVASRKLLLLK